MWKMNNIQILTIYVLYVSYFVKDVMLASVWRKLLSPDDPPLRKVQSLKEMKEADDHVVLDFIGLVQQYSYPAEEHNVTTEDGYHLLFHRIPSSPFSNNTIDNTKEKRVVYMQHGMLCASDDWVLMGPQKDLAFLLADEGYDVWVGNVRGNTYCRSHVNLTTSDRKFWEYSYHEHAIYDAPAMVDYIMKYTDTTKIYYIGYSMGTTISYILLSMKPEYNEKFHLVVNLSPVALWYHGVTPGFKLILNSAIPIKKFLDSEGIFDVLPQSATYKTLAAGLCKDSSSLQPFCFGAMFFIAGSDPEQLNTTLLPHILSHFPCGTSTQALFHYYQNYITGKFRAYDYGSAENYQRYKKAIPPEYDFGKITAPFAMFYGSNDGIMIPENVLEVAKRLKNAKIVEEVPYKQFSHMDFIWARDAKVLLYDRIIEVMRDF